MCQFRGRQCIEVIPSSQQHDWFGVSSSLLRAIAILKDTGTKFYPNQIWKVKMLPLHFFFLKTNILHKSKKSSRFSWSWKVLKRTDLKVNKFWFFSKNFRILLQNSSFLHRSFHPCFLLLLSFCHSVACSDSSQFTTTERLIFRKCIITKTHCNITSSPENQNILCPHTAWSFILLSAHTHSILTCGFSLDTKDDAELSEESLVCGKQVSSVFEILAKLLSVINIFFPSVKRVHIWNYHIIALNPWHKSTVMLPVSHSTAFNSLKIFGSQNWKRSWQQ